MDPGAGTSYRVPASMLFSPHIFRRLCRARDLLCEPQERLLSVGDVARHIGLTPFQLIRQFGAAFGATPLQYRTQVRLDRARELLALDELSVTEVCFEVGFTSLGSFSHLFARRTGVSPSAYRRRVRRVVQVPAALRSLLHPGCLSLMERLPADAFRNFREASDPTVW
jgi:AraC-like DNA-binding protein